MSNESFLNSFLIIHSIKISDEFALECFIMSKIFLKKNAYQ